MTTAAATTWAGAASRWRRHRDRARTVLLLAAVGALLPFSVRLAVRAPGAGAGDSAVWVELESVTFGVAAPDRNALAVTVLAVCGQVLPLLFRRRWPLVVLGAAVATAALQTVLLRPDSAAPETVAAAVAVVALHRPLRVSVAAAGGAAGVLAVLAAGADRAGRPEPLGYVAVVLALAWCAGAAVRRLRARRGHRQAREQGRATRAAVADERARIARELHDVVAQHMAGIAVQAGAARRVGQAQPWFVGEALETIRASAVETATALDHLLAVLQPHGGDGAGPGLHDVEDLVRRHRDDGMPVRLQVGGRPGPVPAELGLNAFRIVQEALTNTAKHAGRVGTVVEVRHGEGDLTVVVTDRGRAQPGGPPGHGLLGMRERVALFGGSLRAGPVPGGGWSVSATFPLDEPSAPPGGPRPAAPAARATIPPWEQASPRPDRP